MNGTYNPLQGFDASSALIKAVLINSAQNVSYLLDLDGYMNFKNGTPNAYQVKASGGLLATA